MTIAQLENTVTIAEPAPVADLFDEMEALLRDRRSAIVLAANRRFDLERAARGPARTRIVNQMALAEIRRAEMEIKAIKVARRIVAEADNTEDETL